MKEKINSKRLIIISLTTLIIPIIIGVIIGGDYSIINLYRAMNHKALFWRGMWYDVDKKLEINYVYRPREEWNSTNKPEEVYTQFRKAIIDNKLEEALLYIAPERREEYKKNFKISSDLEHLKSLPEVSAIKEDRTYGNLAIYLYKKNEEEDLKDFRSYAIEFVFSNKEGKWLISSI